MPRMEAHGEAGCLQDVSCKPRDEPATEHRAMCSSYGQKITYRYSWRLTKAGD